ncbi:MAG: hypothetical protein Q8K70_01165 [Bacteroidota bacterium]|nr:hypothetical protein [Bacteroidota bacterium]
MQNLIYLPKQQSKYTLFLQTIFTLKYGISNLLPLIMKSPKIASEVSTHFIPSYTKKSFINVGAWFYF